MYRNTAVAEAVGADYRQVIHWVERGVISSERPGKGGTIYLTEFNVFQAILANELHNIYVNVSGMKDFLELAEDMWHIMWHMMSKDEPVKWVCHSGVIEVTINLFIMKMKYDNIINRLERK